MVTLYHKPVSLWSRILFWTLTLIPYPESTYYYTMGLLALNSPQTKYMSNKYIKYTDAQAKVYLVSPFQRHFLEFKKTFGNEQLSSEESYILMNKSLRFRFSLSDTRFSFLMVIWNCLVYISVRNIIHMNEHLKIYIRIVFDV